MIKAIILSLKDEDWTLVGLPTKDLTAIIEIIKVRDILAFEPQPFIENDSIYFNDNRSEFIPFYKAIIDKTTKDISLFELKYKTYCRLGF